ncbi:MAG: collagen-like protein [Candidatus Pristimantibacillus lignocellulolyticus]|uniref:Collagen-like protein n=1 Tax=Candidatus Pristimantibacillus lignocellulolyticus TaxID=2994561 RepID=A0A9J6ZFJ4_9BACL|nr:MAG: collagen-like protein [Candidatus Pristimantibacillus lignocellulolyticus]
MAKTIIQIQLLDEDTGEVIETVIPQTETRAVLMADGTSLQTYLDNLVSQKGEKGDKGDQGIQGLKGDQGIQGIQGLKGDTGVKGTDGKTILNGTSNPATGLGVDGDFYINTTTNLMFGPKTSGAWGAGKSLVGPQGLKGDTGTAGIKGDQGIQGIKGDTGATGAKGDKGNPGDSIKYGADYATGQEVKVFFKTI